jgi:hypothetical protein
VLLKVSKKSFQHHWCQIIPQFREELLVRIYSRKCHLDHVLNHNLSRLSFGEFLKREHCYENLDFLLQLRFYKERYAGRNISENITAASGIIEEFICLEAETPVNVPQTMASDCLSKFRQHHEAMKKYSHLMDGGDSSAAAAAAAASDDDDDVVAMDQGSKDTIIMDTHTRSSSMLLIPQVMLQKDMSTLFDECEGEIRTMLRLGAFSRFVKSSKFRMLLAHMRAYHNLDLSKIDEFEQQQGLTPGERKDK